MFKKDLNKQTLYVGHSTTCVGILLKVNVSMKDWTLKCIVLETVLASWIRWVHLRSLMLNASKRIWRSECLACRLYWNPGCHLVPASIQQNSDFLYKIEEEPTAAGRLCWISSIAAWVTLIGVWIRKCPDPASLLEAWISMIPFEISHIDDSHNSLHNAMLCFWDPACKVWFCASSWSLSALSFH